MKAPDALPNYEARPSGKKGRYKIWKDGQPMLGLTGKQFEFRGIANAEQFIANMKMQP